MPYINKGLSTKICPFIEDVTGNIITINNQFNDHLLSLKATIEATQQGSGTPSPDNVRPILGVSEVNITQQVTDMADRIYTINLGGTYYGGVLDVTSGVLRVTWGSVDLGTVGFNASGNMGRFYSNAISDMYKGTTSDFDHILCEVFTPQNSLSLSGLNDLCCSVDRNKHFQFYNRNWAGYTGSQVQTALDGVMLAYELLEPFEVQLTPQQIELAIRQNTIFADTGNLEAIYKTYTPT